MGTRLEPAERSRPRDARMESAGVPVRLAVDPAVQRDVPAGSSNLVGSSNPVGSNILVGFSVPVGLIGLREKPKGVPVIIEAGTFDRFVPGWGFRAVPLLEALFLMACGIDECRFRGCPDGIR
ncbi:hypothetical protein [Cohnella terricola]|uniref:Uncharacterized protein n=1 Tax=Cohnella terricola TaxID=1289167 RepID=A0A559JW37_9BACL|nr:hypothetical protein [Cohnella terricola]TVY04099.1 hypothetical protein FPZ45_00375 [Cohnella terricola]